MINNDNLNLNRTDQNDDSAGVERSMPQTDHGDNRLDFVDGFRGVAMIMVLIVHFGVLGCWKFHIGTQHHIFLDQSILSIGHYGVNLFLVISGFCLYYPYANKPTRPDPSLAHFAFRRCWRILPPYYVALVLFDAYYIRQELLRPTGQLHLLFHSLAWHAGMVYNLRPQYLLTFNGAFWTLALEFQLYVLFPLLVVLYRRFNPRVIVLSAFVLSILYRILVTYGAHPEDLNSWVLYQSFLGRMYEFALGMYAARAVVHWRANNVYPLAWIDAIFVIALIPVALFKYNQPYYLLGDSAWGTLFAAFIVLGSRRTGILHKCLSAKWLVKLGTFSYSVYLIHQPLVTIFCSRFPGLGGTRFILVEVGVLLPMVLALGYAYHRCVERPFMTPPRKHRTSAAVA